MQTNYGPTGGKTLADWKQVAMGSLKVCGLATL